MRAVHTAVLWVLLALAATGAGSAEAWAFEHAVPGRVLTFPRDHGKHPGFQTEWWYFTGNLGSESGSRWGFQLTFFRRSLILRPGRTASTWAIRDLYPAHFALTDGGAGQFFHAELLSREGPGLASAAADDLRVHVRDWTVDRRDDGVHLKAREGEYALDLKLVPTKPPVLHGDSGFSRKGSAEDQASYYYSFTRLAAEGMVTFRGTSHRVRGEAWMDHEFGSDILTPDQVGWDWFSVQLDDGSDLMLFYLRKKDGTIDRVLGTFVAADGTPTHLSGEGIAISSRGTWRSPRTGSVYPSGWRLTVPSEGLDFELDPLVRAQELIAGKTTKTIYWEGSVTARGTRNGKPVSGQGYVELTGYAHSMGGRL